MVERGGGSMEQSPPGKGPSYREIDCPCCGAFSSELWVDGRELETFRFYSRWSDFGQVKYVRCLECGLIYSNPRLVYTESTLQSISPQHVERRWKRYEPIQEKLRRNKAKKVERVIGLTGSRRGRFLEIGCGFGFGLEAAVAHGFDAVGTELQPGFIDACREKGLQAVQGSVAGIPFADCSCSVVFLDDVLEHLDQPFTYLDEVKRVLKPGGILFIHTWVIDEPTSVEGAFGPDWRKDPNLDLTAHTTIYPTRLLLDQLSRRALVPQLDASTWRAQEGAASSAIQFCSILARKVG